MIEPSCLDNILFLDLIVEETMDIMAEDYSWLDPVLGIPENSDLDEEVVF